MIVETGLLVAEADSYASLDFADTYHEARNNVAWASADDTSKEAALIKATDFLESGFKSSWRGYPVEVGQSLAWPRLGAILDGQVLEVSSVLIPLEIKKACAELAIRSLSGTDLNPDYAGRKVTYEKVDVIEVKYSEHASNTPTFPAIVALIKPYLRAGAFNRNVAKLYRV